MTGIARALREQAVSRPSMCMGKAQGYLLTTSVNM